MEIHQRGRLYGGDKKLREGEKRSVWIHHVESEQNGILRSTFKVAAVKKPLMVVRRIVEKGTEV